MMKRLIGPEAALCSPLFAPICLLGIGSPDTLGPACEPPFVSCIFNAQVVPLKAATTAPPLIAVTPLTRKLYDWPFPAVWVWACWHLRSRIGLTRLIGWHL